MLHKHEHSARERNEVERGRDMASCVAWGCRWLVELAITRACLWNHITRKVYSRRGWSERGDFLVCCSLRNTTCGDTRAAAAVAWRMTKPDRPTYQL